MMRNRSSLMADREGFNNANLSFFPFFYYFFIFLFFYKSCGGVIIFKCGGVVNSIYQYSFLFACVLERKKGMFYLTTHSTHFMLRLYGVRHMVKDHSDSERGNPLPPHGLLFPISSKGSFICIIPQTG